MSHTDPRLSLCFVAPPGQARQVWPWRLLWRPQSGTHQLELIHKANPGGQAGCSKIDRKLTSKSIQQCGRLCFFRVTLPCEKGHMNDDDINDDGPSGEGGSDHGEPSQEVQSSDKSTSADAAVGQTETAEDQSTKPSSSSPRVAATKGPVPEVPRWRFISTAKKSYGYSTAAAGVQVEGLSAEEIAYRNAKAAAAASPKPRIDRTDSGRMEPDVSEWDVEDADEMGTACVGKLNINENKDESRQTYDVDVTSKGDDNLEMKTLLEKSTKEKEALQAELEETKKRAAELELNAAMDKEDNATQDVVDVEEATTGQELQDEQEGKSSNAKKRRWWLWLLLLAALVALAGIVGVAIGRDGGNANSSEANEGVGVVAEDANGTQAPVLSPASSIPEDEVFCPEDTRPVKLRISLGDRPSDVTWVVTDTCTDQAKYRCNRCYEDALPNVPVSFEGCLPTTSTFEGGKGPAVGRLRRAQAPRLAAYELRIINVSGGKSDFGYTLIYDGAPVSEVEEFQNFHTIRFGEDSGAGGCTGSPTETPATDPPSSPPLSDAPYMVPTLKPSFMIPTLKPSSLDSTPPTKLTLGPTQNYENELDSCFAAPEQSSMCAEDDSYNLEQEIVFTGTMTSFGRQQHFGSAVTFVGNTGKV
ncbi:hypothetical protein THAOC_35261, partial [Thalassiosira oceanica]